MSQQRKYVIYSDSTCDMPKEVLDEIGVKTLGLTFEIDGKNYSDGELSSKEFYDSMRNGSSVRTSQIPPTSYEQWFENTLENGYDILYIGFSSALSGSYNSACIARDNILETEKFSDRKIICIDSLCASTGEGLLIYKACEKRDDGLSIDELAQWIEDNKLNLCHVFTVDDLKYLHRGGRVSKATAIAGTLLGIKPFMHVDNGGNLIALGKVRGRKASLNKLVEMMEERIEGWENPVIAVCHGDCLEEAEYVAKLAKSKLSKKTKVIISYTGTVIGAHSGPGTMALFFMGTPR